MLSQLDKWGKQQIPFIGMFYTVRVYSLPKIVGCPLCQTQLTPGSYANRIMNLIIETGSIHPFLVGEVLHVIVNSRERILTGKSGLPVVPNKRAKGFSSIKQVSLKDTAKKRL